MKRFRILENGWIEIPVKRKTVAFCLKGGRLK